MATQRIKGQEVSATVLQNGQAIDSLGVFKSLSITFNMSLIEEKYLNETTNRFDAIFEGVKGKAELHIATKDSFTFAKAVIDKARRRTSGTTINLKATFNFPGGDRVRLLLRDVEFGEMPFDIGGRSDYVGMSLDFACSEATVIA